MVLASNAQFYSFVRKIQFCRAEFRSRSTNKYHLRHVASMPQVVPNKYHLRHVVSMSQVVPNKYHLRHVVSKQQLQLTQLC